MIVCQRFNDTTLELNLVNRLFLQKEIQGSAPDKPFDEIIFTKQYICCEELLRRNAFVRGMHLLVRLRPATMMTRGVPHALSLLP